MTTTSQYEARIAAYEMELKQLKKDQEKLNVEMIKLRRLLQEQIY